MPDQPYRDGDCIIVPNGATLPNRCIRCNAPSQNPARKFEFTWNPHGLKMGRSKVRTIAAIATNRRGKIFGHYCDDHQPRVARNVSIMLAIALVGFAVGAVGLTRNIIGLFMAGFLPAALSLAIMAFYLAKPPLFLQCDSIEKDQLHLRPDSADFLNSFPALKKENPADRKTQPSKKR